MGSIDLARRVSAAAAAVAACASLSCGTAAATTPTLMWQGAARVQILCLITTEQGIERGPLHAALCERVRDIAATGAPTPVAVVEHGDVALLAHDAVTLLVHGRVDSTADSRLLAFTIRPYRNDADGSGTLFGAAPRAVELPTSNEIDAALERPLRAALAEILPWLAASPSVRPVKS